MIPEIRNIAALIEPHYVEEDDNNYDEDKLASIYIRYRILKMSPPILSQLIQAPDVLEEYMKEYGFLGSSLHDGVTIERIIAETEEEAEEEKLSAAIASMDPI